MTGSRGFSHFSASGTASKFGASIAGMPSLGGPPDMISLNGTLCFVKSVFHSEVSKGIRWSPARPVADTSAASASTTTIGVADFTVPPWWRPLQPVAVEGVGVRKNGSRRIMPGALGPSLRQSPQPFGVLDRNGSVLGGDQAGGAEPAQGAGHRLSRGADHTGDVLMLEPQGPQQPTLVVSPVGFCQPQQHV